MAKGISFLRVNNAQNALKVFEDILSRNSSNEEAKIYQNVAGNSFLKSILERGNDLISVGNYKDALNIFSEVDPFAGILKNVNYAIVYQLANNSAVCMLNTGDPESALIVFDKALTVINPVGCKDSDVANITKNRIELLLNKGIVLKTLGRNEESILAFREGLDLSSSSSATQVQVTLHCGMSEALSGLRKFEEARDEASLALALVDSLGASEASANYVHCLIARAFAALKLKLPKEALADLELANAHVEGPGSGGGDAQEVRRLRVLALSVGGDQAFEGGDFADAVQQYTSAMDTCEQSGGGAAEIAVVQFNCSLAHMQMGNQAQAVVLLRALTRHNPAHASGQSALGLCLLQMADEGAGGGDQQQRLELTREAVQAFKSAHAVQREDVEILHNLAVAQLRAHQPSDAAASFRSILKISPDNANALQGLSLAEEQAQAVASSHHRTTASQPGGGEREGGDRDQDQLAPLKTPLVASSTAAGRGSLMKAASFSGPKASSASSSVVPAAAGGRSWSQVLAAIQGGGGPTTFPLSELQAPGPYPEGVDTAFRELYLAESEFKSVMGAGREEFYGYPQWKQVAKKKAVGLF